MNEFPSNSHKSKEPEAPREPKVQKVVEGTVERRKTPLGRRLAETFMGGDAKSVSRYVVLDVLLPAAKDMVADAVSQGIERMLFGEVRSVGRRTGTRPSGSNGYVSYNRFSGPSGRREEPRQMTDRARARFEFDDIILPTRVEAEEVINQLFLLIQKYDAVTVADLYDSVGITPKYTDEKWGWTDLRGLGATRVRNGYLLDLTRPEPLD